MSIVYNKISPSINREEVGTIPQIENTKSGLKRNEVELIDDLVKLIHEFPDDIPGLDELYISDDAIITDFLRVSFFADMEYLLVSDKTKDIIEQSTLGKCKCYDAQVFDANGNSYSYNFILFLPSISLVDFSKSAFIIKDALDGEDGEEVRFSSFDELMERKKKEGMLTLIEQKSITLHKKSDLFTLPITSPIFTSEALKNILIKANLSGMKFLSSDVEFTV